jgi:hypothetical protein
LGSLFGNEEIIHLTDGKDGKSVVEQELLKNEAKNSLCKVNYLEVPAKRRGLKPRNVDEILEAALRYLG